MQPATNLSPSSQGARPPRRPRIRSPPTKRRRTTLPNASTPHSIQSAPSPSPSPPSSPSHASPPSSPSPSHPTPVQHSVLSAAKWFRKPSVVWYRGNDLRVEDHPALLAAAQRGGPVIPFFVWDPLDGFGHGLGHVKEWWLRESLHCLQNDLRRLGVQLYTRVGRSTDELRAFLDETGADAVFWNRCYEPDLLKRDEELRVQLAHEGLTAESFKAELLVEPWELSNTDVSPCFETFHAYMRAWMTVPPPPQPFPWPSRLLPIGRDIKSTDIDSLGFDIPPSVDRSMRKFWKPGSAQAKIQLDRFLHEVFPAFGEGRCRRHFDGTSRLSPHIRFGELSPRRMYHATRLRVSRWDQTSIHTVSSQPSTNARRSPTKRPRTGRAKEYSPNCANPEQPISDGTPHDKTTNAHNPVEKQRTNAGGNLDERARQADVGEKRTEIGGHREPGGSTAKHRKSVPVHRKSKLPHISLSARAFLKNLCLRDFSYHVLFHNPEFNSSPLVPEFNSFPWAEDNGSFDSWRNGVTGYPIVDAAMRELRATGWIHNGMRFLLACFLTKHLLLPWSRGLGAFYGLLIDGDHSSNALGWQWTAGCNTDAFPVNSLVNPVKVAYRHDPSGNYVRRWVPELAKLPTEYIHQPWKAPEDLLARSGIEMGSTYPNRVILMSEARDRASKAMTVMKKILGGSTVMKSLFKGKDSDNIREWPDSQPEVLHMEESQSLSGKKSLLPSLWALLQCDQPSTYLSGNSSGSDTLIAMDTASLVEGALAVPLEEQHESIEHALISAHEQAPSDPMLSAVDGFPHSDRDIDGSSFSPEAECNTASEMQENQGPEDIEIQQLEEPLKYANAEMNAFSDQDKQGGQSRQVSVVAGDQGEGGSNSEKTTQEMNNSQFQSSSCGFATVSQITTFGTVASQYSHGSQPHLHQQFQQLQQLQQLRVQQAQQAQQQQQQQQPHFPVQRHSIPVSNHSQSGGPQSLRQLQDASTQGSQGHPHARQPQISPQQTGSHILQPSVGIPTPQQPIQTGQQAQAPRRPQQAQSLMDGGYNSSIPGASMHGSAVAGVPMSATPVMLGPVSSGPDLSTGQAFATGDPGAAMYSHHLGMNPLYGFQPVMPGMNTMHLNGSERFDMLGVSAATNSQKLSVSGMMPVGYGMYGSSVFDPNVIGNVFAPNAHSYGNGSANSQSQGHLSQQSPYALSTQPMYFAPPSGTEMLRGQSGRAGNMAPESIPTMLGQARPGMPEAAAQRSRMSTAATAAQDPTGQRDLAINVGASEVVRRGRKPHDGNVPKDERSSRLHTPVAPSHASNVSARMASRTARAQSSRGGSKPGAKGRQSMRNRRTGRAKSSAPRTGTEGRGQGASRARAADGGAQARRASPSGKAQANTLKSRQEMLRTVLESDEHEYQAFAQYLSVTYELTGNTDRQTSRDYVRLCNLKDDYHRQYPAEKDRLKIYSMKRFFSQFMNLEVTGEWDRHNHGGVRGPYVYGIRQRKQPDSLANGSKN